MSDCHTTGLNFTHTPLNEEGEHIRLIRFVQLPDIQRSPEQPSIQCYIQAFDLKELGPGKLLRFKTLSYLWGSATERIPILINGHTFNVLPNLHKFPEQMRDFEHGYL